MPTPLSMYNFAKIELKVLQYRRTVAIENEHIRITIQFSRILVLIHQIYRREAKERSKVKNNCSGNRES